MTDLFASAANADRPAAQQILTCLRAGDRITRVQLNEAMTTAYRGSDADGRWTQRESFELLEHATARYLRENPYPLETISDAEAAISLLKRLPTQTVRSEDQVE